MNIKKIQEWMKNKGWESIGREKIILLALAGIMLIGASYFENGSDTETVEETVTDSVEDTDAFQVQNYQTQMEKKVKKLVESIEGISDATVVISLKSGSEKVLQEDSESTSSEKNSGSDTEKSSSVKKTTVLYNQDGNESPYVIKEKYPEIEGIAVVAKGVSDNKNKEEIINMLSALFNVAVHKISVLEVN